MSTPEKCRTQKMSLCSLFVLEQIFFCLSSILKPKFILLLTVKDECVCVCVFWPKSLDCLLFVSHLYVAHSSVLSCDQWGTGFGKVRSAVCCLFVSATERDDLSDVPLRDLRTRRMDASVHLEDCIGERKTSNQIQSLFLYLSTVIYFSCIL